MKFLFMLILISLSINAAPIKVEKSEIKSFGCSYKNLDYYHRDDIDPERVTYSQALMDKITDREEELYNYLKLNVTNYHYVAEESVNPPGYIFYKYFFEYQGDRVTVYSTQHEEQKRTIGFCFEGKFTNDLVKKFFNIEAFGELTMEGNGEFYLIDDANSVVKFIKKNGSIEDIYIYIDYD